MGSEMCIRDRGEAAGYENSWLVTLEGFARVGGRRSRFLSSTDASLARCAGAIGKLRLCIAHGGGKRCSVAGCNKAAQGQKPLCKVSLLSCCGNDPVPVATLNHLAFVCWTWPAFVVQAHGGGRRCKFEGCPRSARDRTDLCIGHGGGKRCAVATEEAAVLYPPPALASNGCLVLLARSVQMRVRRMPDVCSVGNPVLLASRRTPKTPAIAAAHSYTRMVDGRPSSMSCAYSLSALSDRRAW